MSGLTHFATSLRKPLSAGRVLRSCQTTSTSLAALSRAPLLPLSRAALFRYTIPSFPAAIRGFSSDAGKTPAKERETLKEKLARRHREWKAAAAPPPTQAELDALFPDPNAGKAVVDTKDPFETEAERQLAAGNVSEAIGLHPDAGLLGKSGLMEKYGLWSTLGLFAFAAISKEWYILDEEIVLVGTFSFAFLSAYISLREPAKEALQAEQKEMSDAWMKSFDDKIAALQQAQHTAHEYKKTVEEMKPWALEDQELAKEYFAALERNYAQKAQQDIEKALQVYEATENKQFTTMRDELAGGAAQHAIQAFTSGADAAKLRASAIDSAINAIKTGKRGADPVKGLVDEYVSNFEKNLSARQQQEAAALKEKLVEMEKAADSENQAKYLQALDKFFGVVQNAAAKPHTH